MKYFIFLLTILAIIICCNTGNKKSNLLLKPDDIKADEYIINTDRDTTIETKNGALLKIPKGALTSSAGNAVTLEIKEAYSMQQMIQAGLVTQSDGEPLSSGGMIYINAKAGQDVKITQAIKVAIPTDYLSNNMQLFKGEKDVNGNINWKEPTALSENKQLNSIDQGQVLFQSKCASCHAIGKDGTGPNLAHVVKRFGTIGEGTYQYYEHGFYPYRERYTLKADSIKKREDISGFRIYNEQDAFYPYKCNLMKMYGSVGPIMFNDTSTNDYIDDIYRHIQNESDKRDLPLPLHAWLKDCADSCAKYKKTIDDLQSRKELATSKKEELARENGRLVEEKKEPAPPVTFNEIVDTTPPPPVIFEERVSPQYYDAEYYQFTIESFGWFNIDVLLKGIDGVKESELFVRITGEYREKVKVFLIIPSAKVYGEGGPAERDPNEFAFFLKNGKILLPQNAKAYIMAVTEREESIAFALKEFTTALKQEFDISLNRATKEEFNVAISKFGFENMKIKVADAKNANEVRETNSEIKNIDQELKNAESLRPKNCNCDCGQTVPAAATIENVPQK